jgi:hypothetical protein
MAAAAEKHTQHYKICYFILRDKIIQITIKEKIFISSDLFIVFIFNQIIF